MIDLIKEIGIDLFRDLLEIPVTPSQRFYWGTLISSLLTAWILLYLNYGAKKSYHKLSNELFSKRILLHPSSYLDLKISLFNLLFKSVIVAPVLGGAFVTAVYILKMFRFFFPHFEGLTNISPLFSSILYTLIFFIISDFMRFLHHFLMHKNKILRVFHRLHHSAEVLTPLTLLRAHPVEVGLAQLRNLLSYSLALSISVFFLPQNISGLDILGVNLFSMLFNLLGSNFRHSSISLNFGLLEYIFISPRMHQVHHSNQLIHLGKNFGVSLSIWDHLTGSFYRPTKKDQNTIIFGLQDASVEESRSLKNALWNPVKLILKINY
jgi:sterol desaturase/sphingolipid hydroxylase (fatty acid hydroxylase superfamily)